MAKANLTAERLRELLHYDPETGIFTWKVRRGMAPAGSAAGSARPDGRITIYVDSVPYEASTLAWLYVHGEFPPKKLRRKNGVNSDNRIANFHDPYAPMPKVIHPPLTADRLRELVAYDPDTGVFTRRKVMGKTSRVGDVIGSINKQGRLEISVSGKIHFAHRLAWLYMTGDWPKYTIDHIDGDPINNRFANLRDVPHSVNTENVRAPRSNSRSGILGVAKRHHKWRSAIVVKGKYIFLGSFATQEEASDAYVKAKRLYHTGNTL